MEDKKNKMVWVVFFSPDGIPKTYDGEWAGCISAHSTEAAAKTAAQSERDSGVWGDFSECSEDDTSSDRQLFIEVDCVTLLD